MYREVSDMPHCVCCGILIPAQPLAFRHHEIDLFACSARCERLYETYKFPRYKQQILDAERSETQGPRLGYAAI
jgi:hypothetical protein